jgi:adenylosuccinate lyase
LLGADQAAAIEACCKLENFNVAELAAAAAHAGTLAIPLVAGLRRQVARIDQIAAGFVHLGATSQDVADTALMLQCKQGAAVIERDLSAMRKQLAVLARAHAQTPMLGRTLLQGALPITFGLKVSHWLAGLDAAAARLSREGQAVALQFGGAAGTRAGLAATLLSTLPCEHERGLGGWQAEAPVLAELFMLCHGALAAMLAVVAGLEVDTAAMLGNLKRAAGGTDFGEAASLVEAMLVARDTEF